MAGCEACDKESVVRSHLMEHRKVEHERFFIVFDFEIFQINFGTSFLKFHLIFGCFFKHYF